ncbi:MAG: cobyric acid synthase [Prevotella sp.]|nr:cobyric acid synthase [Prevotella sp.]
MRTLHPIMFAGTGSDVGKSIIAAAFCRIFRQDGYHPAPFKAQNMALNSYATPDGLEIGRAQAVQAEAAGIPCHTDMNPLLLKPSSDHTSQVVLHGKPIGNRDAYDFWNRHSPQTSVVPMQTAAPSQSPAAPLDFRAEVCAAFDRLSARFNPIVMEGAGSISELNLRDTDLVNLPMARHARADVILVADIDRGGVFASVYGSIALQQEEDRRLIKGIIINKFRGDLRLFDDGRQMLEKLCGVPVLGVVPYYKDIYIEEEDSVALEQKRRQLAEGKVNVAVVLLRHISNFTDFDTLERDARVNLFYTNNTSDIQQADIIILPGTKSTLDDLLELRRNGCAQAIVHAHREGRTVVGICGGYQMLGLTVNDPDGIEGPVTTLPGLGLLPIHTTITPEKTTRQCTFIFDGRECHGYEIHQGVSDTNQSILQTDRCIGTYIHGFLDNAPVIEHLLKDKSASARQQSPALEKGDYFAFKEEQYDRLAAHVRKYVDIDRIYQMLTT